MRRVLAVGFGAVALLAAGASAPAYAAGEPLLPMVFVVDSTAESVLKVTAGAEVQDAPGVTGVPRGVDVADDGMMYVTWLASPTSVLMQIAPDGTATPIGAFPDGTRLEGIDVASDGTVYVGDSWFGVVYAFAPDGTQSTFATGLTSPKDLVVADDGTAYVTTWNEPIGIQEVAPDGTVTEFVTDVELLRPSGIDLDADGNLLVADIFAPQVYRFAPDGTSSTLDPEFVSPEGLSIDDAGDIYVSDDSGLQRIPAGSSEASVLYPTEDFLGLVATGPGVATAPTITGTAGVGAVGTAYSATFSAAGFPSPTLSVSGALPPGLAFDPATGTLSGTPTTAGTFGFAIVASNGTTDASLPISLVVAAPGGGKPAGGLAASGAETTAPLIAAGALLLAGAALSVARLRRPVAAPVTARAPKHR